LVNDIYFGHYLIILMIYLHWRYAKIPGRLMTFTFDDYIIFCIIFLIAYALLIILYRSFLPSRLLRAATRQHANGQNATALFILTILSWLFELLNLMIITASSAENHIPASFASYASHASPRS
jgi:hypothetical protein